MKKSEIKTKHKTYIETKEHLNWMKKNLNNHDDSNFIRSAVDEAIKSYPQGKKR